MVDKVRFLRLLYLVFKNITRKWQKGICFSPHYILDPWQKYYFLCIFTASYFLCGEGPRSRCYGRAAALRLIVQLL
jgi:hypothetical protein